VMLSSDAKGAEVLLLSGRDSNPVYRRRSTGA
jgi:hypothetical protein